MLRTSRYSVPTPTVRLPRACAASCGCRWDCTVTTFADGEVSPDDHESVRGSDVFGTVDLQAGQQQPDGVVIIDACRRASAGRITAVIPYFGYARQDRKAKGRDPISAKLVANMIEAAGADRVLTMDLHASQIQGFFDIPADNLLSNPVFVKYYMSKFEHPEEMVVVSPTSAPSPAAARLPTRWA